MITSKDAEYDIQEHSHFREGEHGYHIHTHAWASMPHNHILRAICGRRECSIFPTHNIHPKPAERVVEGVRITGDGNVHFT